MSFMFLSEMDALPHEGAAGFELDFGGEPLALVALRAGERVQVFHNVCPHAGRRLDVVPGRFIVDTGMIVCAAHGACFSIPAGDCIAGPCRGRGLRELPSQLREDGVWVELGQA